MSEPTGVILHDADTDKLIQVRKLIVHHEGRLRELSLRVARGTIRDVRDDRDYAFPTLIGEPGPLV